MDFPVNYGTVYVVMRAVYCFKGREDIFTVNFVYITKRKWEATKVNNVFNQETQLSGVLIITTM